MSAIALYTAVYPGAAPFLAAWYASVQAQADRDFDLWISLDGLTEAAVVAQLGDRPAATFVVAEPGYTPAQVRQQALTRIADHYDAVVLVDSDDLLHPDRVAAARAWLEGADVAACGLRLVDEAGQPLGLSLATPGEGGDRIHPAPHQRVRALEHGLPVRRAASLPPDPGRGRPGGLVPDHDGLAARAHGWPSIRRHEWTIASTARTWPGSGRRSRRSACGPTRRWSASTSGWCWTACRRGRCRPERHRSAKQPPMSRPSTSASSRNAARLVPLRAGAERSASAPPLVGVRRPPAPAIPVEHPEGANVRPVNLGTVAVGGDNPPYVVAEVGSNHNGDMDLCLKLIDAAAEAGADAVKFQSWSETSLIAREEYERNPSYTDKKKHFGSLREMVRAYQLTPEQHVVARDHARERGIAFSSSAFAPAEADMLAGLDVPFIKIASMDITNLPLLAHVARTGKPVVISTGMATLGEIERAMDTVRAQGNEDVILLHCVSIYPAAPSTIHLRNLETLRRAFDVPVGFSDHTLGTAIPLAAIALGACMIEKHFTLDQEMEGWDHAISSDPAVLRAVVEDGRTIHEALGSTRRMLSEAEIVKRRQFRRSLVTRAALPAGHVLTEADLDAKRPGTGIGPDELRYVVGRELAADLVEDQVLRWEHLR